MIRSTLFAFGPLFGASAARAQQLEELLMTAMPPGEGWAGFLDVKFLVSAFFTLSLAALLGALVSYHPRRVRTADTLEEIEAPKVSIMYAVIGALIGIMVVKYGTLVGFVLFGIGGLIRFRTVMSSAHLTGQVIFVTLIGLSCGMDLPHVAVLATAFAYLLMFLLEARITYQLDVRGLPEDHFGLAVGAYRTVLEDHGCHVLGEQKRPHTGRVRFIFRSSRDDRKVQIEKLVQADIDPTLRGSLDWYVE
jgi:hypothetical protein